MKRAFRRATQRALQRIIITGMAMHQWTYIHTDGRFGETPFGRPMLLLRTAGCRTGLPRTTALLNVHDAGGYAVVASNGGSRRNPGWFHNLMAQPDAEIQIGRKRIPIRARVADEAERTRLMDHGNQIMLNMYSGYQKRTERTIPVLVLEPR